MIEILAILLLLVLFGIGIFFLYYYFVFARDPVRSAPPGNNIVAPTDGTISAVLEVGKGVVKIPKGYLGKIRTISSDVYSSCYLISIVMTPLDVHFQRAPCDGKVLSIVYKKGKFLNAVSGASDLKATLENESNEILFSSPKLGRFKVIQIAGFLARRINCFVQPGKSVKKGEKIGFINLGSQVTLIIPKKRIHLHARVGDRVYGGLTIIADLV